jgi:hypothetical protein
MTGGLIADDDPAHLTLDVVQLVGPARGVELEVWPADETQSVRHGKMR